MSVWLHSIVVDANDPRTVARFWADALGWVTSCDDRHQVVVEAPEGHAPALRFARVHEPKRTQNRLHLDLRSESPEAQAATVERLERAGARHVDVGQHEVPWVVLADTEGNEFCVLDPREEYATTGSIAAIVCAARDPRALASFWSALLDWPTIHSSDDVAGLRAADGVGPFLEFVCSEPTGSRVKNRIHLDVAPRARDAQAVEVERAIALGARLTDIGRRDIDRRVMIDPEGNEFCMLPPTDRRR